MLWETEKKYSKGEEIFLICETFFQFIRLLQEIIVGRLCFGENFLVKLLSPVTLEDDFPYGMIQ